MSAINDCACRTGGPGKNSTRKHIGVAPGHAEIDLWICALCGGRWLHYFLEHEAFSESQRSYAGYLANKPPPPPHDAAALLNTLQPRFAWSRKEVCWNAYLGVVRDGL